MTEYQVNWAEQPTAYHPLRCLFIIAESAQDAEVAAKDYIKRKYGIVRFSVYEPKVVQPLPEGTVREGR